MDCPNCKKDIIKNDICSECGTNILIYNKISQMSNKLYNDALIKIRNKDVTGAIENLKKSVIFNGKNYFARNLLGLIYFEYGFLADAYNNWIISSKITGENNLALGYIKKIESNADNLEKLNDAVKMYNQSIIYLKQKSDDMAIIQLKKAIEINPQFLQAMNLLSLCYIIQKDNAKAISIIEKVLSIDKTNVNANNYQKEIGIPKIKQSTFVKEEKVNDKNQKSYKPVGNMEKEGKLNSFNFLSVVALFLGLFLGFTAFYILIMPSTIESNKAIITKKESDIETLTIENKELKSISEKAVSDLKNIKTDLEQKNKTLEEKVSIQDKIQNINNAADLISRAKYEEASILLFSIDKVGLPTDIQDRYSELVGKANPRTSVILYDRANVKYKAKQYDEAAVIYNECLKYANEISREYGDALYFLGEIAITKGDTETAKKYFTSVVAEHENARNYWKAKNKLVNL